MKHAVYRPVFRLLLGSLLIAAGAGRAQPVTIRGQVDADHLALPNVQIRVSGQPQALVSDAAGQFALQLSGPDTLVLTHPDFPPRRYVLPRFSGNTRLYVDMATNQSFWVNESDDKRGTLEAGPVLVPTPPAVALPAFPWPVPAPSAKVVLNPRYFASVRTLGEADKRLADALAQSGYPNPSYYGVPHGFALVTRLEQIDPDGTPKSPPARWSAQVQAFSRFSLSNYLMLLFRAATGHFRIIVFLVTDVPIEKSATATTADVATAWYDNGADYLPPALGRQPFTPDVRVTALIYEFEKPENSKARLLSPSGCLAEDHLRKAQITGYLTR